MEFTGSLTHLAAATGVFVGTHFLLSGLAVRRALVTTLGEWPFRGLYSAVALVSFLWMLAAYRAAPSLLLWDKLPGADILTLLLMPLSIYLVLCAYTQRNPASAVPMGNYDAEKLATGVLKITRHPAMWGITLWSLVHLATNGDAASVYLYGGLGILAVGGAAHLDGRSRREHGDAWQSYFESTSFLPMQALITKRAQFGPQDLGGWRLPAALGVYGLLVAGHGWLAGISVWPF